MSSFAYTSPDHKPEHQILASDINSEKERNQIYYCPGCNARFKYKAQSSNLKDAHFFKLPSESHDADCWVQYIESTKGNFSASSTAGFSCASFYDLLTKPRKRNSVAPKPNNGDSRTSTNTLRLDSIRNLYKFCLIHPDRGIINEGVSVRDVFVGKKTAYFYTTFVSGYKLIEAEYYRYEKKTFTIYFTFPYQQAKTFDIAVKIPDEALFKTIVKRVFNNTKPILLYSNWSTWNSVIFGEVVNLHQILAL